MLASDRIYVETHLKLSKYKLSMKCLESFDEMCKQIVCPQRFRTNDMVSRELGKLPCRFSIFDILNSRNLQLECLLIENDMRQLPTVIYLHGNGGTKLEVLPLVRADPYRFNYCSFDFAGCGKSQGNIVTYGINEANDVSTVVEFLKNKYGIKNIHLWGRSMGACAAILYASMSQSPICSLVLDCPFPSLEKKVIKNVSERKAIPGFVFYVAIYFIKSKVYDIAKTDVFTIDYTERLQQFTHTPILFAYSSKDDMVLEEDVVQMFENYNGDKLLFAFEATHTEERPMDFYTKALHFVSNRMQQRSKNQIKLKHTMKSMPFLRRY